MRIAMKGIPRPIDLTGCENLVPYLSRVLHGWSFAEAPPSQAEPIISVRRAGDIYRIEAPWIDQPVDDQGEIGAVCSLLVDVVKTYIDEDPKLLCLHCGAARFAGRLVVFPSWYRAGKSTLLARLAAAGVPIFADDVMAIAAPHDEGVAPGIALRLRVPLPENASAEFRDFVKAHRGPGNRRYLYLDLPAPTLAPHGERAPIGAFVLLDRQGGAEAELLPAAKSHGLQRVILQNFAYLDSAEEILARLHRLVHRSPCFVLRYSDLEDAATLLQEAFAHWPPRVGENAVPFRRPPAESEMRPIDGMPSRPRRARLSDRRYMRAPDVVLQTVDDEIFLASPRQQSICHLNTVGAGLWQLLAEPTSAAGAAEIMHKAFPGADRRQIVLDVAALFRELRENGLIVPEQVTRTPTETRRESAAPVNRPRQGP